MRERLTILHCRSKTEAKFLVISQLSNGVSEENYLVEDESHLQILCLIDEDGFSTPNAINVDLEKGKEKEKHCLNKNPL